MPDLADILARLPSLAGHPREISPLAGGLSNRSYKVVTPSVTAVLRIPAGDAALLGIDRENEYRNTLAAHAAGIGPPVLDRLPAEGVTVVGWLDGRTPTPAELHEPAVLDRVVAACRTLHSGRPFATDVDLPAVQREYRVRCHDRGLAVPPGYDERQPAVDRIVAALAGGRESTVPCHNDLGAANMLDTGTRVWFVDYEYAGNNDPDFELGTLADEAGLPPEPVVERYYGRPRPSRAARARLYAVLARHTWVLWAAIQAGTGALAFDYPAWGAEQYARSSAALTAPELPGLLAAATGVD
jgi:thiamine kinase-like enzyme